jgi:hypothetical protein
MDAAAAMSEADEHLVIERDRNRVILTLNFADWHAAIRAYEKLIAQAREGYVFLDVEPETRCAQQLP